MREAGVQQAGREGGRERRCDGEGKAKGRSRILGAISIRAGENE